MGPLEAIAQEREKRKREVRILTGAIGFFTTANLVFYFSSGLFSYTQITGNAAVDLSGRLGTINLSTVLFGAQFIILAIIVLVAGAKYRRQQKDEKEAEEILKIKEHKKMPETRLDQVLDILGKKESISVRALAKAFQIEKELATEWGRILEEHNLAVLDYPPFSDPEIKRYVPKEKDGEKNKKKDGKKDGDKKDGKNVSEEQSPGAKKDGDQGEKVTLPESPKSDKKDVGGKRYLFFGKSKQQPNQ